MEDDKEAQAYIQEETPTPTLPEPVPEVENKENIMVQEIEEEVSTPAKK